MPLVFKDGETKEIRTILSKRDDGFAFVVISRVEADADEWHEHARGDIAFLTAEPQADATWTTWNGAAGGPTSTWRKIRASFSSGSADLRRTGGRWSACRVGAGEGLATLRLADAFAPETDALPLHPALADVATGFMSVSKGSSTACRSAIDGCVCGGRCPHACTAMSSRWRIPNPRNAATTRPSWTSTATCLSTSRALRSGASGSEVAQDPRQQPEDQWNFCVEIERPGSIATLGLRSDVRRSPGPGEAEIEVGAAGLNFIEVLYALGMLPEPPGGMSGSGSNAPAASSQSGRESPGSGRATRYSASSHKRSAVRRTAATSIALKPEQLYSSRKPRPFRPRSRPPTTP